MRCAWRKRIQDELAQPFVLDKNSAFASSSIGIALSSSGYDRPEDILRDADTAMYRAKENGKARYEVFDHGMHARAVSRLQLESDLRRAVEQKQFCVYYQPIVSLQTGRLAGFEGLVRWNHPRRGLVSPGGFHPRGGRVGFDRSDRRVGVAASMQAGLSFFASGLPSEGVLHLLAQDAHRNAEPALPLNSAVADDDIVVSYSM